MNFFIKNPNLTKKILAVGRGGGGGVARESDFFSSFFFKRIQVFSKESKSEKKNCLLFEEVKVREDWIV